MMINTEKSEYIFKVGNWAKCVDNLVIPINSYSVEELHENEALNHWVEQNKVGSAVFLTRV